MSVDSTNVAPVGLGLYCCLNSWLTPVFFPQNHTMVAGMQPNYCMTRFPGSTSGDEDRALCLHDSLYATGECADCQRPLCEDHSRRPYGRGTCADCTKRVDAVAAHGRLQPFFRALNTMLTSPDRAERVVRWFSVPPSTGLRPYE